MIDEGLGILSGGGGGGTALIDSNNLSDVVSASTSRTNLGFSANTTGRVLIGDGTSVPVTTALLFADTANTRVGVNQLSPGAGATLDVGGTSGGVGLPVLTTTQRDAITPARNGVLIYNSTKNSFDGYVNGAWADVIKGSTHANLSGLSADDHTQYFLLNGRDSVQTATFGTGIGAVGVITSTSHATKGKIQLGSTNLVLDEVNTRIGVGTTTPRGGIDVVNTGDSLFESFSIAGAGASDNNTWLFYASAAGSLSIWNRNQVLHGIVMNTFGNLALGAGAALGHPSSTVIICNQAGANTTPTLAIVALAAQSADMQQWCDSTETVIAKVTSAGLGSFAGVVTTAGNTLQMNGATSGSVSLKSPATPTSYTLTLPTAQGGANQAMINDGSGNLSWTTVPAGFKAKANVALSSGTTSKAITFGTSFGSTNYAINAQLVNTVDSDPIHVPLLVIAKAATGFTVEWGDALPTSNYVLDWSIVGQNDP